MAYGGFRYLLRIAASDKEFFDETFNITENSIYVW